MFDLELVTPPGVTVHVGASSEKAGVQGGCPRGGVFEERPHAKQHKSSVSLLAVCLFVWLFVCPTKVSYRTTVTRISYSYQNV